MASMPGYHITKGPFGFLDRRFDGMNPANYTAALNSLTGTLLAAAQNRFPNDVPKVQHFQNDWLGNGAWNQLKPEETLREGLKAAINAALSPNPANPKPMEFFWVCARERAFHVYYSTGPHQINVFIFTPPPVDPLPLVAGVLVHPENLFVVKKEDWEDNPPGSGYPGGFTTLVAGSPGSPAIITRQIFGEAPPN